MASPSFGESIASGSRDVSDQDGNDHVDSADGEQGELQQVEDEQEFHDQEESQSVQGGDLGLDCLFDDNPNCSMSDQLESGGPRMEQAPKTATEQRYSLRDRSGIQHPRRYLHKIGTNLTLRGRVM